MKRTFKSISLILSISLFSACASSETAKNESGRFSFGDSNRLNIAAHLVEPDPELKANTYIPADGDRLRAAREAYRSGKVKEPLASQSTLD